MVTVKLKISGIPAMIWGEKSDKVYLHVHGKMSRKEYAEDFARIAQEKGYQTLSFDLPMHGERAAEQTRCDIWNGVHDLKQIGAYAFSNWKEVSLAACSLGAFFSLHAYPLLEFQNCLFQSPILDMEYLIRQMMAWFGITQERFAAEQEIETPVDTMSWAYYQYVKTHPVSRWEIPTHILYGAKDHMQSRAVVEAFAKQHGCKLTVSENSEHPFMAEADRQIVADWLYGNI